MTEEILTTIDVGNMLGVHQTTIIRWIESGKLKAHTTLGQHRRVKKSDLVTFFKENDMIPPDELNITEKQKVLIVDDDKEVLTVLAGGFRQNEDQFEVETATDGFEAGQMVAIFEPDLVILDIFLPTINGFKVCKTIKDNYPDTKIIAITGQGSKEVKQKILKAGADDYIEKPFEIEDLSKLMEELLEIIAV